MFEDIQQSENKRPPKVKVAANSIYTRQRAIPSVKFEADSLMTSFGGLVIFQALLSMSSLFDREVAHIIDGKDVGMHGVAQGGRRPPTPLGFFAFEAAPAGRRVQAGRPLCEATRLFSSAVGSPPVRRSGCVPAEPYPPLEKVSVRGCVRE